MATDDGHVQVETRGQPAAQGHARSSRGSGPSRPGRRCCGRRRRRRRRRRRAGRGRGGRPAARRAGRRGHRRSRRRCCAPAADPCGCRPRTCAAEADHGRREACRRPREKRDGDRGLGHEADLGRGAAGPAEVDVAILGRQARCHELADEVADGAAREAGVGDEVGARLGPVVVQAADDRAQVRAPHALAPLAEVNPGVTSPSLCSPLSNLCETDLRARRCQVVDRECDPGGRTRSGWRAGVDNGSLGRALDGADRDREGDPGDPPVGHGARWSRSPRATATGRARRRRRARDPAQPRLLRGAARRSRRGRGLRPAAQPPPRRVVDPGARGRQARPVREAARAVGGRRGADGGGGGGVGTAPDGSLHVPASPQLGRRAGARGRWPDRAAAGRGQLVLLLQRRSGQHPQRARVRRRRAVRHRLLLGEPLAPPVRRRAGRGLGSDRARPGERRGHPDHAGS